MTTDQSLAPLADAKYGSAWQRARLAFLRKHPLCADHAERGMVVEATVVDHKIPHKGDRALFWDSSNWQSLCKLCHDGWKQRQERGGVTSSCGLTGMPTDPRHPWATMTATPEGGSKVQTLCAPRPDGSLRSHNREMDRGEG